MELEPDPAQLGHIHERLGHATDLLEPRSRLFLATAMLDRAARGNSPHMDYSPVSMGIVKALETELGAILDAFARRRGAEGSPPAVTENDRLLQDFLTGKSPRPTLGQLRHLLKTADGEVHREWVNFVDALPGGPQLRNSRFREFLHKATVMYRNPGVHDRAITLDTAEKCLAEIVGAAGQPGRLAAVAVAKAAAQAV